MGNSEFEGPTSEVAKLKAQLRLVTFFSRLVIEASQEGKLIFYHTSEVTAWQEAMGQLATVLRAIELQAEIDAKRLMGTFRGEQ